MKYGIKWAATCQNLIGPYMFVFLTEKNMCEEQGERAHRRCRRNFENILSGVNEWPNGVMETSLNLVDMILRTMPSSDSGDNPPDLVKFAGVHGFRLVMFRLRIGTNKSLK